MGVIIFGISGEGSELNMPSMAGDVIFLCVTPFSAIPHPAAYNYCSVSYVYISRNFQLFLTKYGFQFSFQ